jgi:two-component system, chemotaxis family, protein-glutamate methylesterase/glutaminase
MQRIVVIGASAGGLQAVSEILSCLPQDYPFPIVIVQHRASDQSQTLEDVLQTKCRIKVKQVDEKETIKAGMVYVAAPAYHLLIERDHTFSLSADPPVKHSIPSIDVTFQSAAEVFQNKLVGIILTGSSNDGSEGIKAVKYYQGVTIAQDPREARFSFMPKAAIDTNKVDFVMSLQDIKRFMTQLATKL